MKYLRLSVELFFRATTYIVSTHPFLPTQLNYSPWSALPCSPTSTANSCSPSSWRTTTSKPPATRLKKEPLFPVRQPVRQRHVRITAETRTCSFAATERFWRGSDGAKGWAYEVRQTGLPTSSTLNRTATDTAFVSWRHQCGLGSRAGHQKPFP